MGKRGWLWLGGVVFGLLPAVACVGLVIGQRSTNPEYTDLARYDITPSGQPVLMFEFNAARDRVLFVAQAQPPADNQHVVRVEAFLWDMTTRRVTSVGQFDGVALREHPGERYNEAIRASGGDFFLFTTTLVRIGSDGRVTSFPNRTQSLTPDEVLRIGQVYGASQAAIYRIDRGVAEPQQSPSRYYLFTLDGQTFFLHNLTQDPLVVTTNQVPSERVVLDNPVIPLDVPHNPDLVRESPLFNVWNSQSYESKGERLTVTTRRNCFMVPMCPHYPEFVVKVERRGYVFDWRQPFVPQSGYMTAKDGTLFWLREGHLFALR